MSQVMSKIKQIRSSMVKSKPGESTSRQPGLGVRDSFYGLQGDLTAGTFTLLILFSLSMFVNFNFNINNTYATASSIGISISGSPTVNVQPSAEGRFADSGNSTITITTTHAAGYTLSVKADGQYNPTSLDTNGGASSGGTIGFTSLESAIDYNTFDTNSNYNGKWGYKPSKYNSTNNSNYLPSPSPSGEILDTTSNADDGSYTVSIGARTDSSTNLGSYSNQFVFAVVSNPTPFTLTYDKNTTSTVTNMPTNISDGESAVEGITLASNVPTRNNYTFQGWCTVAMSDGSACTGTQYAPSDIYNLDQTASTNNITLYAMWTITYTITYKASGGTGSDYTQDIVGTGYLSGNHFTRTNYYFKGWGTSSGTSTVTYRAGQSITPTANMTLYAVWASSTSSTLYNIVASLNNSRTLDNTATNGTGRTAKAGIRADITKENSGVFTYNSSTFGTASDSSTSNTIYLYRGILDDDLDGTSSTYGSNGNSANYPNYVKTSDLCWRIVRTTGSGGVKMIYNGHYSSGTTANSCANVTSKAQVTTKAFNGDDSTYQQIVRAGYTHNSTYATNSAQTAAISTVFRGNSTTSGNNTRSTIKTYIEDTWYTNNMTSYTSKLEASAGYCNDRTMYASSAYTTPISQSTSITTYGTSGLTVYYFGAYARNRTTSQPPSLTCAKYGSVDRSTVDLYRYSSSQTTANYLKYPAALLTADEASFAGSGRSSASQGSAYHANSFLRSGSNFWLLSPFGRVAGGNIYVFSITTGGIVNSSEVYSARGVRPVISLKSGTKAASGSGTATDPWVVSP